MKQTINSPFNTMTKAEYLFYIENHAQYANFNTLGLYRSLSENTLISLEEKIEIRDFANTFFQKTFDFLVLKDPYTYFNCMTLGEELTKGDEQNWWRIIIEKQEKMLKDKQFNHRNFGTYSKHNCGYDTCPYNGLMVKMGSKFREDNIIFPSDHHIGKWYLKEKATRQKSFRKNEKAAIKKELDDLD
jgi:hypothetical protein